MSAMQTKILDKLRTAITDGGLEAVDQPEWANTGAVYAMVDLETSFVVRYSFQSSYCTIAASGPAVTAAGLDDNPPVFRVRDNGTAPTVTWHHLDYTDGARLRSMLDVIAGLAGVHAAT